MINPSFFPSRRLAFYMVRLFLTRSLAVLFALVLILMTLDLLGEAGNILAVPGNSDADLWRYVALRLPILISRFMPFSVLLGTLIAFVGLNQNSEVVSMKAAGLSAHQILAPLLLTALIVGAGSFGFNERVVTRANATLKAWDANEYKKVPKDSAVKTNVFLTDGTNILSAASVTGTGVQTELTGVTWYRRAPSGAIADQMRAPRGVYANP